MSSNDSMVGIRAPKFLGAPWFNSEAIDIHKQDGVVLVDFWTYSCMNCLQTLPHLRSWYKKYSALGLTIIGVHTPEFGFEKKEENVQAALKRLQVEWPVVMDNNYEIWHAFANSFWPRKYLINHEKKIVYDHIGEGNYPETEKAIREALLAWKPDVVLPPMDEYVEEEGGGKICYPVTPELYCGHTKGRFGYEDLALGLKDYPEVEVAKMNAIYLKGAWELGDDFLRHAKTCNPFEDYLALKYQAKELNLVCNVEDGPYEFDIKQDGVFLSNDIKGEDVQIDPQTGRSFVKVTEPRMYRLVKAVKHGRHLLQIYPTTANFLAYAFTFKSKCD